MTLSFSARHGLGAFTLDAAFESAGGLTALFGRSGSGKTTIVNIIGGLLRPERGRVVVDGRVLFDSEAGIDLPPHRRRLGCIFQEGRLFPHLTVRQNLLYGRWFTPRRERYGSLDQVVALLGLEALLHRQPGTLSGGEKQRVAIGRALLAGPRLLLMDEPLAALDAPRKAEILPYIERMRDELSVPIIYVSHSIDEIARLATTVALVSDGRVVATGAVGDILSRLDLRPLTGRFEAGALIEARLVRHDERFGLSILEHPAGELRVPRLEAAPGALVRMRVRARDVALAVERPHGLSIRNVLRARVTEIAPGSGPQTEIRLDLAGSPLLSRVTREAIAELGLAPGREVYALIKSIAFDRRSLLGRGGGEISDDDEGPRPAPGPAEPQ